MSAGGISGLSIYSGADLCGGSCAGSEPEIIWKSRLFFAADFSVFLHFYRKYEADPGDQWFSYLDCPGKGTFDWDPYKSDNQQCAGGNPAVRFCRKFFSSPYSG